MTERGEQYQGDAARGQLPYNRNWQWTEAYMCAVILYLNSVTTRIVQRIL